MNVFMLQHLLRNIGKPFIPRSREFLLIEDVGGFTIIKTEENDGVLSNISDLLLENGDFLLDESSIPMSTE